MQMKPNDFMEQIIRSEKNHRIINVEKLILKSFGYNKFQELETKIKNESQNKNTTETTQLEKYIDLICAKFVENGKHCLTCQKIFCNDCFDETQHVNHEITEDDLCGICWCGNKLEGYQCCEKHHYECLSFPSLKSSSDNSLNNSNNNNNDDNNNNNSMKQMNQLQQSKQIKQMKEMKQSKQVKETKEMKEMKEEKQQNQTNEIKENNSLIHQSIQNIFSSCLEMINNNQEHRDTTIVLFRTILKFIQNKRLRKIVNEHLEDQQIITLCKQYNIMNRQRNEYPFFKYYQCVVELLLFDASKYELCMTIANRRILPLHLFHLFSCPQYQINHEDSIEIIQQNYQLILQTVIHQLNVQITESLFKNQLKLCVRRLQSLFFNNLNLLTEIIPYVNKELSSLLMLVFVNINHLFIQDLSSENKNISDSILFEYIKIVIKTFWKFAEESSNEQFIEFLSIFCDFITTHAEELQNQKQLFDIIFGFFLIEIEKRNISFSEHEKLSKMDETIDLMLLSCLRRLNTMKQFIPSFEYSQDDKITKAIQTRNNPTIIEHIEREYQTIGKEIQYQYSLGKIISLFEIIQYKLKKEGLRSFMKKCRECRINEFYANEIIIRTLHFNPLSSRYIQSSRNLVALATKQIEFVFKTNIFGLCLNGEFTNSITFDIFNPIMLILPEERQQLIINTYITICSTNDYPLFYGVELEEWKRKFIEDQELLINFNVMINRNVSLTYLLVDLLWLRVYNNCPVKSHQVNKRIADILKRFQSTSTISSKTVWRLMLEYSGIDQQLVEEFFKSSMSKGK